MWATLLTAILNRSTCWALSPTESCQHSVVLNGICTVSQLDSVPCFTWGCTYSLLFGWWQASLFETPWSPLPLRTWVIRMQRFRSLSQTVNRAAQRLPCEHWTTTHDLATLPVSLKNQHHILTPLKVLHFTVLSTWGCAQKKNIIAACQAQVWKVLHTDGIRHKCLLWRNASADPAIDTFILASKNELCVSHLTGCFLFLSCE